MKLNPFGPKKVQANQVDALIGSATQVDGNVKFSGGLRIEGQVNGSVEGVGDSMVVLTKAAMIGGSIKTTRAIIDGTVSGPMVIAEHLEIRANARIVGDVTYKVINVQDGAIIDGRLIPMAEWPRQVEITEGATL